MQKIIMAFFYDSLNTVKKLKFPTKKEIFNLTVAIFVVVIISGLLFVLFDTAFSELYRGMFYAISGS